MAAALDLLRQEEIERLVWQPFILSVIDMPAAGDRLEVEIVVHRGRHEKHLLCPIIDRKITSNYAILWLRPVGLEDGALLYLFCQWQNGRLACKVRCLNQLVSRRSPRRRVDLPAEVLGFNRYSPPSNLRLVV